MIQLTLLVSSLLLSNLPITENNIYWQISEEELKQRINVEQVSDGVSSGHGYSDFQEINPIVYVDNSSPDKKVEFYFHQGKLYKLFTIYRTQQEVEALYQQKIKDLENSLGKSKTSYVDELFSMPIRHVIWESEDEQLDLRFGAGYVYEVRIYKPLANDKQIQFDLKHAI